MNRGSWTVGANTRRIKAASMRPRFMNRGSTHRGLRSGDRTKVASMRPRFMNRGSEEFHEHPDEWPRGFNEAPIHESGKYPAAEPPSRLIVASMRPRFMNRGSHGLYRGQAEIQGQASMRPRFMNRGSTRQIRICVSDVLASMRPRFMNRGSVSFVCPRCNKRRASMRPRFMNRGSASTSGDRSKSDWRLQ